MAARNILTRQCLLEVSRRAYSSGTDKNVAFLGLGNMGGFMAANLVKQVLADVAPVEPHVPAIVNFMTLVACEPERTDGHMSVIAGLTGDLCTVFGQRVLPYLETRPILDLLQAARRSRTPRTKTLANWATKEIRKIKQATPLASW